MQQLTLTLRDLPYLAGDEHEKQSPRRVDVQAPRVTVLRERKGLQPRGSVSTSHTETLFEPALAK